MKSSNNIVFGLAGILLAVVAFKMYKEKNKERYADVWYNGQLNNTMLQRPTFNSNLDPNNPSMRFDPNVYGGYLKGASPPTGVLAASNQDSRGGALGPQETINRYLKGKGTKERFTPVTFSGAVGVGNQSNGTNVVEGTYQSGMNDAASYDFATAGSDYRNGLTSTNKKMQLNNVMNLATGNNKNPAANNYDVVGTDFAFLATSGNAKQQQMQDTRKYKASLDNAIPNTMEYTLPSELLPTPDMRQPMMRDPSDPSNFMYDRTLFAPLKSRNLNTPDRVRGDLDIQPIKTGYFDVATQPEVDLAKGYFGSYVDISQYQDLQDIAYEHTRDANGGDLMQSDQKLGRLLTALNQDMMKPNVAYSTPPPLNFGPLKQDSNPWYNSATDTVNSVWAK
jgi:hypothetical protein